MTRFAPAAAGRTRHDDNTDGASQTETADGDIGLVDMSSGTSQPEQDHRQQQQEPAPSRLSFDLPDLELPAPALPTPNVVYPLRPVTDKDKRSYAQATAPIGRDFADAPPPVTPLRPILNPQPRDSIDLGVINGDVASPRPFRPRAGSMSPTFAPRDDELPHPEHVRETTDRVLHPLYTPARRRRAKGSRRSRSIRSGQSGKSSRSGRFRTLFRVFRRGRGDKRRSSRLSLAPSFTRSSSSSSSTSTSSSGRSSKSSSTWAGWRFWRNSSSGSSTSDRGDSDEDEDAADPLPTMFTLLTPYLGEQQNALNYPEHLLPRSEGLTPAPAAGLSKQKVFDLITSAEIGPALERLQIFWNERKQEDGLAGDIGASVMPALPVDDPLATEEESYFPRMAAPALASAESTLAATRLAPISLAPTPVATPIGEAPTMQEPNRTSARILRGAERALRAEQRRFGQKPGDQTGPAWWLDITCPSITDLKELRKLLPLHPLTMEDIMHQETREKIEAFPALGYYFIIFRALDESYFRYESPAPEPTSLLTKESVDENGIRQETMNGAVPSRAGRVEIVEGVGGKEGVEGVGVGAINMYLIVFDDGILSFHFEDLTKHIEHVQGRLQSFGAPQSISSHWIAYSLMDSVVDAFFPLINFIEAESAELGKFLADPLRNPKSKSRNEAEIVAPSGIAGAGDGRVYDQNVVGIMVDASPSSSDEKVSESGNAQRKLATVRRSSRIAVLRGLPFLSLPSALKQSLPKRMFKRKVKISEKTMMVSRDGVMIPEDPRKKEQKGFDPMDLFRPEVILVAETTSDRATMLRRIADSRKLVTALSRLLWSKTDVVRGLRKRTKEDHVRLFRGSTKYDIGIYLGDLVDHIVAMQQSLHYQDAILANDHPAYAGLLRLSSRSAKHEIDKTLVKLSMVTITFLVMNVVPGMFTLNLDQPTNGARGTHLLADGVTLAPFNLFGIIIGVQVFLAFVTLVYYWIAFRTARRHRVSLRPLSSSS